MLYKIRISKTWSVTVTREDGKLVLREPVSTEETADEFDGHYENDQQAVAAALSRRPPVTQVSGRQGV